MKRLLLAVGLLFAVTATPARAASTSYVGITSSGFHNGLCPSPAGNNFTTISPGDTVRWTNCDDADHDITWDTPGIPDPGPLKKGESVQHTFTKPGFYDYHDESGSGQVIVQGIPATTAKPPAPPGTTTTAPNLTTTTTALPSTTASLGNVFEKTTTSQGDDTTTSTTGEEAVAPISNKDSGANSVLVALTLAAIVAVVGGGVVVVRRLRARDA